MTGSLFVALKQVADAYYDQTGRRLDKHLVSEELASALAGAWWRETEGTILPPLGPPWPVAQSLLTLYGIPVWVVEEPA